MPKPSPPPEFPLSPWVVRQTLRHLWQGDVIAYPTEAVFGIGCDPLDGEAVARILEMKRRPMDKGLILVASELSQLEAYTNPLSSAQRKQVSDTWPGPVTWIMPCPDEVPVWLRGHHNSLAVRVSAHPAVQQICRAFGGPIVSTSANLAGRPPARSPLGVRRSLRDQVDYIVHAPLGGAERPTQIRVLDSGKVLRD
ncbi:MAG: threonylcarbamoyl-AMP synthase [Gammaproteobacteria bacterium]|nr:threonylcarbamoyl-AMP synthase [Gammaproteobacteria bacterium]